MSSRRETIFIYGSLRNGGPAHHLLAECDFVAEAKVRGTLYDAGWYPALVPDGPGEVSGEIWSCPAAVVPRLDRYEGVDDGLFRRVRLEAGGVPCWAYAAGPLLEPRLRPEQIVPSGRWPMQRSASGG